MSNDIQKLRKDLMTRWGALDAERSSWMDHWRSISEHLLPRSGRFLIGEQNQGRQKHNRIIDNTGTRSLRILAAGMMAGMTSPARPWFRLTTSIPELDESAAVKQWLADVTRLMQMVFSKSNTYRALHSQYEELGAFGSAANIVTSDYDKVIHNNTLTIGEYALAANNQGMVDTVYREFPLTVAQVVAEFGLEKCSRHVREMYERGALDQWVTILHAIEPRKDRDPERRDARNMPWRSVYFEKGGESDKLLRESGYRRFPALCSRWAVAGGDIYGHGPGMEALGDIKQLQQEQLRKSQAIDYKTRPPLQVPTTLKNQMVDILPGGLTFYDPVSPQGGIRSLFEVNLDLSHLLEDVRDVRERIKSSFYADLFLMLTSSDLGRMTATEVAERHEEKLLMLGPVLERLHSEILDPLITITFERMLEAGVVPPPPEELQGMELNVEFVSILAQAQRAVATNGVDRFVGNLGMIAQMKPDVLDKFDVDKWVDAYSDMLGVDPDLIVPSDQVALIRQQRAQAQQAMQQAAMMQQGAQVAKDLSQAKTGDDSVLSSVMDAFTGYT